MNLDSLSFTLSQISYLVASLTKRKYKQVAEELGEVSVGVANRVDVWQNDDKSGVGHLGFLYSPVGKNAF